MKTLSDENLELLFEYSNKVYLKEITRQECINKLNLLLPHSKNSIGMYIDNYRYLRDAIPYGRNMGKNILEYFLTNIYNNFGIKELKNALESTYQHIILYFLQTNIKQESDRKIGQSFAEKYKIAIDFSKNIFQKNIELSREEKFIELVNSNLSDPNLSGKFKISPN